MRKLTPKQREAKNLAYTANNAVAEEHIHDENCGHSEATPVVEVAPVVEDKPKKKSAPKY